LKEENLIKIQNTKKGQKRLFDFFYTQMYAVAFRYLKHKEDTEDVLIEAFVRVFQNVGSFQLQGEGSMKRWIKTIVINESLRMISKRQKLVFSVEINEFNIEFDEDLDASIDLEYIFTIVDSLPVGYRIVFQMFVVDGYSHKEIADKLGIKISTSKSQLFKARSMIMKKLKQIENYEIIRN
jgi:RNA polymerase sigma-70 factor (ECF subfamily)